MSLFLIFFLIPFSFANGELCSQLSRILTDYEKDLSKSAIQKCTDVKISDLTQGHVGLPEDLSWMEERKCSSLAGIESELERLKAQLSVANGIEKLKLTLSESQKNASQGNREAGMTFVSSLNTAQSLEVLLKTVSSDNKPILQKLKGYASDDKRKNLQDLIAIVTADCKGRPVNEDNACNKNLFNPDEEAATEILSMVQKPVVDEDQVKKWQDMLAIQKDNTDPENAAWSFTEMQSELQDAFAAIDKNEIMSRDHLNAIKRLDKFTHVKGFSFVENLATIKDQKKTKILSDKLFVLMGDAKLRQQYEVRSKLSVTWENYKHLLKDVKPETVQSCEGAKFDYKSAKVCYEALKNESKNITDADLKDVLLPSIASSIIYVEDLENSEIKCSADFKNTGLMPESCYDKVGAVPSDLQQKIRQLNILKAKIGDENLDKMTYRNFALKMWADKCPTQKSIMDQCDLTDDYAISKNALLAVKDTLAVAIVFEPKPEAEKKAEELCEDESKKKRKNFEEVLCKFFEKTEIVVETNNGDKGEGNPPVNAPDGKHQAAVNRDRYIDAGTGLLTDVLSSVMNYKFGPQNNTPVNPYPYNYSPYNYGNPPIGIADSIMFNARFHGAYGFYMPTPGYQPYTAFGASSNLSAYKPLPATNSRYFGK